MDLSVSAGISLGILTIVYFCLITEKVNKVIVTAIGACLLIALQVFRTIEQPSQENAFGFIHRNLDVLGFIIGMMILVGIVRRSGVFEAIAIGLVKVLKGNPRALLAGIGYLAFVLTVFISNIPTILILSPILVVLVRQLKLPYLPFFFAVIAMANIAGATTPISDPTTYYEAKTVGLSFLEVVKNSGMTVVILSVVTTLYCQVVFRKQLAAVKVDPADVAGFSPRAAIKDKRLMQIGVPLLLLSIFLIVGKDLIGHLTGVSLDSATIIMFAAFLAVFIFRVSPTEALQELIEWEIIFFFIGLFIVVGSLEFTGVIGALGRYLVVLVDGHVPSLLFVMTVGSALISVFIDNVPYNITMVGAIQEMAKTGIVVYPLWWGLNVGTSVGGAGSMIGAACNVIALGHAEKEGLHTKFLTYLAYGVPLVIINSLVAYGVLWLKFFSPAAV